MRKCLAQFGMVGLTILSILAKQSEPSRAEGQSAPAGRIHHVPSDYSTIQAAIDAAGDGDTVLVAPGTYQEGLRIAGKSIRLVSTFDTSGEQQMVRTTILDGIVTDDAGRVRHRNQIILVEANAGPKTEIVGFTIRNGDDGISCLADIHIAHNYFTGNDDAIDFEGGGGVCEFNKFEKNTDDAVDYDLDCDATVQHNEIVDNDDDGIEIRFHDYRGRTLQLTIRDNIITGNGEDGIQIIDYPGLSDRHVRIERNPIARNAMAGIGCMDNAISKEDYRAADIPEPIDVINNTIVQNEYGITGGDNMVAFNNVIAENKYFGIKQIDVDSIVSHNLLWKNGSDFDKPSVVRNEHTLLVDPQLDAEMRPQPGSPCIAGGTAKLANRSREVEIGPAKNRKSATHLGAFASNASKP